VTPVYRLFHLLEWMSGTVQIQVQCLVSVCISKHRYTSTSKYEYKSSKSKRASVPHGLRSGSSEDQAWFFVCNTRLPSMSPLSLVTRQIMETEILKDPLPYPALQDPDIRALRGLQVPCYKIPRAPIPGKFILECRS